MVSLTNTQVQNIVRKVIRKQELPSSANVFVNDKGENGLAVYIRSTSALTPAPLFMKNISLFLQHGFNLYQPDHRGTYPFLLLLQKLRTNPSSWIKGNAYLFFLRDILIKYPPPVSRYRQPVLLHPLVRLYGFIVQNDKEKENLYRNAVSLITLYFPLALERGMLMDFLKESIRKGHYEFYFPILMKDRYPSLEPPDFYQILSWLVKDRSRFQNTLDDTDDELLKNVMSHTDWETPDFLFTVVTYEDYRALRMIFPLIKTSSNRTLVLDYYLSRPCDEIDMNLLNDLLKTKTRTRRFEIIAQLLDMNCLGVLRVLYDHGVLNKKTILRALEENKENPSNASVRYLEEILERDRFLTRLRQTPSEQTTQFTRLLHSMKPDVLHQLSTLLLK